MAGLLVGKRRGEAVQLLSPLSQELFAEFPAGNQAQLQLSTGWSQCPSNARETPNSSCPPPKVTCFLSN